VQSGRTWTRPARSVAYAEVDLDAQPLELVHGVSLQRGGERMQDRRVRVEEHDPRLRRVDAAEVALQRPARKLDELSGELDTGGAGADDDECQPELPEPGIWLALGQLERAEDAAAQLERVVDRLHARRMVRELRVPEVRLLCARGEDQAVVGHVARQAERVDGETAGIEVDRLHVAEQHVHVAPSAQDVSDRRRDVPLGEDAGGELLEQWLEQVMIRAVE
jgi:hypothetical protein